MFSRLAAIHYYFFILSIIDQTLLMIGGVMKMPANKICFTNHIQATSPPPKSKKHDHVWHNISFNNPGASLNLKIKLSYSPSAGLFLPKESRRFAYINNHIEVNKVEPGITNTKDKSSFFTKTTQVHSSEDSASKIITEFIVNISVINYIIIFLPLAFCGACYLESIRKKVLN
ncbi:hypothetical protein IQ89_09750 [Salmonella enterica]|nr:hypothetical protein [Salmonella enterica]